MRRAATSLLAAGLGALSVVACGLSVSGSRPTPAELLESGAQADDASSLDSADIGDSAPLVDGGDFLLDGSACSADLLTDGANCGACGHSCLGAVCAAGLCTPGAAVTFTHDVRSVSANATRLYFTSEEAQLIAWVPLANVTAVPVDVLTNLTDPRQVTVDDTNLYWVQASTAQLRRATLDGPPDNVIVNSVVGCVWLGPAGDGYVANYGGNSLSKFNIANTNQTSVLLTASDGVLLPWGVAATATDILWTNAENGGGVFRRALGGGAKVTIATGQGNPNCIALDNGFVYWANHNSGEIRRARPDGTDNRIIASGQTTPTSFAFDPMWIYWNSGNSIMRVAR